jgi:uroporphyrinogen decarboxylase
LAACRSEKVDRPPVWLMRQAGRYLPEYREIRAQHGFWDMMRNPELAAKVTLQPLKRFGMDAAILFCDILVVLDALGAEVRYQSGGPVVSPLFNSREDLDRLRPVASAEDFSYVQEALKNLVGELHPHTALIGFAGAPFTLASYLVEEGPGQGLERIRALAREHPDVYDELLTRISDAVSELLVLQLQSGADAVQLFDTWAGQLSFQEYRELALPYCARAIDRLDPNQAPVILYVRGADDHLEAASDSGCTVLSVDSSVSLPEARKRLGPGLALQGNFDPDDLHLPADRIRTRVHEMMDSAGPTGYIVNLGRGLTPDTPVEGVQALVEAVKEYKPQ